MTNEFQCLPQVVENPMINHKTSLRFVTRQNAGMQMLKLLIFCCVMNIFTEASHLIIYNKNRYSKLQASSILSKIATVRDR